ncbi:MAG: hypothetical protein HY738_00430 [Bacteroidia bacterium]|nr:hypothetical protein [Bacteroidia bacterium]
MEVNKLHNEAMELAELAFIKKFNNDIEGAKLLFKKAFEIEKEIALYTHNNNLEEPSRSVLLRSAASLAINSGELREAEKLIALGLSEEPPFDIAEQLRNLLEEVNFERHLKLKGISIDMSEIQLTVVGPDVGFGMIRSDEFLDRINTFEKLTQRTAERKLGKPFREKGISKEIKKNFIPYLSVPRAASFAITIKFGKPDFQLKIPGTENAIEIIEDILNGIEMLNNSNEELLKEKIKDEAYYRNFTAYAKKLAPDGEKIKIVGFTVTRDGKEKIFSLTRKKVNYQY